MEDTQTIERLLTPDEAAEILQRLAILPPAPAFFLGHFRPLAAH